MNRIYAGDKKKILIVVSIILFIAVFGIAVYKVRALGMARNPAAPVTINGVTAAKTATQSGMVAGVNSEKDNFVLKSVPIRPNYVPANQYPTITSQHQQPPTYVVVYPTQTPTPSSSGSNATQQSNPTATSIPQSNPTITTRLPTSTPAARPPTTAPTAFVFPTYAPPTFPTINIPTSAPQPTATPAPSSSGSAFEVSIAEKSSDGGNLKVAVQANQTIKTCTFMYHGNNSLDGSGSIEGNKCTKTVQANSDQKVMIVVTSESNEKKTVGDQP